MNAYTVKKDVSADRVIVADDMILTSDMPTTAGSRMLDGYMSLFEAEVLTRLTAAGYTLGGKASVGEFAIDLLGETSAKGALTSDGVIKNAAAEIVSSAEAMAAVHKRGNSFAWRIRCGKDQAVKKQECYKGR